MPATPLRRVLAASPAALASAVAAALVTAPAAAQPLQIPVTSVLGTNVFGGPSFTVPTALGGTATLSLTVAGGVSVQSSGQWGTNAAGVIVVPGTSGVGQTGMFTNEFGTFNFGALLIGNTTLGFRQLFAATAANGLGSAAPPTTLTLTDVPLSSIFGGGLQAGTVLELRVADFNTFDNGGSFTLSQPSTVIPEPSTHALLAAGLAGAGAVAWRRRRVARG